MRQVSFKLNLDTDVPIAADIVTETDREVEDFISAQIQQRYTGYELIGEETFEYGTVITDKPTFIIDPIDGTSNFVHRFPEVGVSIGLVVNKEPVVGVVYNPFYEELWAAAKGQGAFTQVGNGTIIPLPIVDSPLQGLQSACVGIEWGNDREGSDFDLTLKVFTTLARTTKTGGRFVNSIRSTGSAAIQICRVAGSQQDLFWHCGCWAWDVAAAWCILLEAGGRMVDAQPNGWNPPVDNRRYFAVRPAIKGQEELVKEVWDVIGEDRSLYGPNNHSA